MVPVARREAMKTALKAGAYATPVILSAAVPATGVAAATPPPPPPTEFLSRATQIFACNPSNGTVIVDSKVVASIRGAVPGMYDLYKSYDPPYPGESGFGPNLGTFPIGATGNAVVAAPFMLATGVGTVTVNPDHTFTRLVPTGGDPNNPNLGYTDVRVYGLGVPFSCTGPFSTRANADAVTAAVVGGNPAGFGFGLRFDKLTCTGAFVGFQGHIGVQWQGLLPNTNYEVFVKLTNAPPGTAGFVPYTTTYNTSEFGTLNARVVSEGGGQIMYTTTVSTLTSASRPTAVTVALVLPGGDPATSPLTLTAPLTYTGSPFPLTCP